jgi:uncharacterized protein YndB with AHSA1/START domain
MPVMHEFHGSATAHLEATPEAVFELITDVGRLPEWNDAIESVAEQPPDVAEGAEWLVVMHPAHLPRWRSRSTAQEIDRDKRRFAYRTVNADGNPSYAVWHWQVDPADDGSEVTVTWDVFLKTADRRWLAGPLRRRGLRHEVAASLPAIDRACHGPST